MTKTPNNPMPHGVTYDSLMLAIAHLRGRITMLNNLIELSEATLKKCLAVPDAQPEVLKTLQQLQKLPKGYPEGLVPAPVELLEAERYAETAARLQAALAEVDEALGFTIESDYAGKSLWVVEKAKRVYAGLVARQFKIEELRAVLKDPYLRGKHNED